MPRGNILVVDDTPANLRLLSQILAAEGYHVRPEEIDTLLDFAVKGLLAVYRVPDDAFERDYWPAGEYGLVFAPLDTSYPHLIIVLVEDGRIVRLDYYLGETPYDAILDKAEEFVLPPVSGAND